jgi:hypothetical protein
MITRVRKLSDSIPAGLIAAGLLTVLALARFNQSLWSDEASSLWFSRQPIGALLTSLCDPHPPGYYLLLKFWALFGSGEAWLRLPSLLAALGALAITYRIARTHSNAIGAGLATLLLALQPLHSWYASEVRMYAPVECAGLLAVWLGWRAIDRDVKIGSWLAYALAAALSIWFDYTAVLPLALLQLIWIARGCPQWRRWIGLHVVMAALVGGWWLTGSQVSSLGRSYQPVFIAIQATRLGFDLTPITAASLLQWAALGAIGSSLLIAWYAQRHTLLNSKAWQLIGVGVWVGVLAFSAIPAAFTLKRLVVVGVPYVVLGAAAIIARWPRKVQLASVALSAIAALSALLTFQREPWRAFVYDLATRDQAARDQTATIWVDELSAPVFDYYWSQFAPDDAGRWAPLITRAGAALPSVAPAPAGSLSIVTEENVYRRLITLLPDDFWAEYQPIADQRTGSLVAYQFTRRLQPDRMARPPARSPADEWGRLLPSPLDTCTR